MKYKLKNGGIMGFDLHKQGGKINRFANNCRLYNNGKI